mgnify:CR=1 FL=1
MQKGLKTRYIIHQILYIIKKESKNFDAIYALKIKENSFSLSDKKLIQTVVLNCMRNYFYIDLVINKFAKKIKKDSHSYFLLLSAITQILILNFKEYAVINTTVEIAKNKKLKTSHNYINAILRNIVKNKKNINIKINFLQLPEWFRKKNLGWNLKQKKDFISTIRKEPNIHLVFKSENYLKNNNILGIKTSNTSLSLTSKTIIEKIDGYSKGLWWVQDFAAMLPVCLLDDIKNKNVADLCAAPGGKTFQLISKKSNVTAFEKNLDRLKLMKKNMKRLNMNCKIINKDVLTLNDKFNFDLVVLDAPCSAIGTIRRNPEIFFRKQHLNFKKTLLLQESLLEKSKQILKKGGILLYIVCSFFKEEGVLQINKFLEKNKNFKILKFNKNKVFLPDSFIDKEGYIITYPSELNNGILIDGFFAARLIKDD